MSKVISVQDNYHENLSKALGKFNFERFRNKKVLIKVHVGELGNKWYVNPKIVKVVVDKLKEINAEPFLYDTLVLYTSPRAIKTGHKLVAKKHGFTSLGCPFVVGDKGKEIDVEGFKFEIAQEVLDTDYMIVVSHGKGHGGSGFGGAIKNVGMGCVSKKCKRVVHSEISVPAVDEEKCILCGTCERVCEQEAIKVDEEWRIKSGLCVGCGECIKNCPQKALDYKEESLNHMLAYAAKAATKHMKEILYINVLLKITKNCDCATNALPIICDDVGILVSGDMLAIDQASIDLIERKMGRTFQDIHQVDPLDQVRTGEKIDLGSSEYSLTKM